MSYITVSCCFPLPTDLAGRIAQGIFRDCFCSCGEFIRSRCLDTSGSLAACAGATIPARRVLTSSWGEAILSCQKQDTWPHSRQQRLLSSSTAGRRLRGDLCLGSTRIAGLTAAGTPSDHTSVVHCCTVTAQLFRIAGVSNTPICGMKQIQGTKQKIPFVSQILVYAKDLYTNTGPKYYLKG